jgi:aroC: chorismate synthase
VPVGLGEPFFDSLESQLAHLAFSIPAVRGIEFGDGFAAARMKGSEHNDCFVNGEGKTATNGAGGINGGISNGNPVVFRIAVKPTFQHREETIYVQFCDGTDGRVRRQRAARRLHRPALSGRGGGDRCDRAG